MDMTGGRDASDGDRNGGRYQYQQSSSQVALRQRQQPMVQPAMRVIPSEAPKTQPRKVGVTGRARIKVCLEWLHCIIPLLFRAGVAPQESPLSLVLHAFPS